ncbi:MAG TPA: hypothetical protein PLN48_17235 [Lachnospiraceae bacterium]|nr:hypothetical protein [Lachnospiraceae bacterium]
MSSFITDMSAIPNRIFGSDFFIWPMIKVRVYHEGVTGERPVTISLK